MKNSTIIRLRNKRNLLGILDGVAVYDKPSSIENTEKEYIGLCESRPAYK